MSSLNICKLLNTLVHRVFGIGDDNINFYFTEDKNKIGKQRKRLTYNQAKSIILYVFNKYKI